MKNKSSFAEATNLRRDCRDSSVWRRVGVPAEIASSEALPIAEFNPFGGNARVLLLAAGRALYVAVAGLPGSDESPTDPLRAPRELLGMLAGEPLEVDTTPYGVVKIQCRRAPAEYVTYTSSGVFSLRGPMPPLPSLSLRPDIENTVYHDFPAFKLSGRTKNLSGSAIDQTDIEIISEKLLCAYDSLKLSAANSRAGLQPILARYRLRDVFGQTVFLSAPSLVAPDDGFQMCANTNLVSSDQFSSVSNGSFTAKTYHMAFAVPEMLPAPWNSIVASVEVEASPQLDPVDPEDICSGSRSDSSRASVYLPGIQSVKSARIAALRAFVVKAVERAESLLRPVGKLAFPFDGSLGSAGSKKYFRPPRASITENELDSLPVTKLPVPGASYGALLSSDGLSLRAIPSRQLPKPMGANGFAGAVSETDGLWKSAVAVTLSRGSVTETVVTESSDYRDAPLAFGPLVIYPDSAATELSVNAILPDGTAVARSFHLTPIPEAGLAYWIEPEIARVTLPATPFGYEVPLESLESSPVENVIEVFLRDSPDSPVERIPITGTIEALAEAPRSGSSWDFARGRFLCFGSEGTRMITLDAGGNLRSSVTIDNRPVASPDAVARADGPDGAVILAIAGGDLLKFSGSKVTAMLRNCRAERPGWCARWREIWLFGGSGGLRRISADGEILNSSLDRVSPGARCRLWRGNLLIAADGALFNAADETPVAQLPFRLALDYAAPSPPKFIRAAIFDSAVDGRLSLYGHNGSEIFGQLAALNIRGEVNAPIRIPVVAPWRRFLRLAAGGRASPDLAIRALFIDF